MKKFLISTVTCIILFVIMMLCASTMTSCSSAPAGICYDVKVLENNCFDPLDEAFIKRGTAGNGGDYVLTITTVDGRSISSNNCTLLNFEYNSYTCILHVSDETGDVYYQCSSCAIKEAK